MKTPFALSAALAIALAGCAAQETQVAQEAQVAKADCKIAPITTRSVTGKPAPVTELDRRYAEMQLGTSDYRRRQLDRNGPNNTVEDALKDCR